MARLVLPALLGFCCAASTVGSSEQRAAARDYCGIGGGLAGLQLGHFLQQASRDYVVLEAGRLGGEFFRQFPRHRKLISIKTFDDERCAFPGHAARESSLTDKHPFLIEERERERERERETESESVCCTHGGL
jgi:cation diffusion facilitator CzcD-associated flavoprotein CzcO